MHRQCSPDSNAELRATAAGNESAGLDEAGRGSLWAGVAAAGDSGPPNAQRGPGLFKELPAESREVLALRIRSTPWNGRGGG